MRRVGVSTNGLVNKGLAEINQHMLDEGKEVSNGVDGGGQGLSEQDESRIIEDADNEKGRRILQVQPVAHRQQPQGPVVRWERLLPFRSIRVLLVENDDATRHIVSALLRNCSYEVTAVANGLEAWKTLEGPTDHIDLVLTEVDMPYLSGIGLLSKILSHKTCKHIPLIMMSSNDSMGIVFKCLSKGAVDFLVKPIRKNELKNLWQHVWRKCHNQSTFSGSESGIRIQKSSKSRSIDGPENNNGSNGEDDIWSTGTNAKDGSDNGSGTQSSWKKGVVEVDNTKPMTQWDKLGDPPDSTCAQVIHSKSEPLNNYVVRQTTTRECRQKGDELDNVSTGTYLKIGIPINQGVQLQEPSQSVWKSEAGKSKSLDLVSKKDGKKLEKGRMELNNKPGNGKLRKETFDLMDVITNSTDLQMGSLVNEDDLSRFTLIKDKTTDEIEELPSFEPDLNTLRDGDTRTSASERNVLRHSDLSAFSRYNTSSNANQTPTGNVGSCSPPNNSSEATKIRSNSNGTHNQHSHGSSNNDDMGSTTNNGFSKLEAFNDKQMSRSIVNVHPRSAFQSVKAGHNLSIQPEIQDKTDPAKAQARVTNQQVQVQRHHLHYHHHHYHVRTMQQNELPLSGHGNLSLRNTTAPIEGNAANYSLNGSGSSCNNYRSNGENGSNGQNAYNIVGTVEGTNMESDNGGSRKFGADDGNRSGSRSGVDQNRWTLREAALNKFRQKRKDRCFEKKVRYQSRKRLAEQRPRVKGQFVRQVVNEDKMEDPNS